MIKEVQAVAVVFVIFALGLIYAEYQVSDLQGQVSELQDTTSTIVETLYMKVNELDNLIVECGVTIDNGTAATTETVYLTRGATALEALRRIAVVETTYYTGLGEFIDSINGVANDLDTGKYWMFYILEDGSWTSASVGAGSYKLKDSDNIRFNYETPSW